MSFIITPICFMMASITWFFVSKLNFSRPAASQLSNVDHPSYFKQVFFGFILFFKSIVTGAKLIFSSRKFVWLLPGYSLALYAHRYLENGIAPIIAKRYLGNSAWSQIMVGGSNMGELLGAGFVFLFTNLVGTPMPWLRLDSMMLFIVWYLPYWYPTQGDVRYAWMVAATLLPVSFGWAAGDVSLAAYIQASLARKDDETEDVSALGAVMSFLYSTYIVIYAICNPLLGRYVDGVFARTGGSDNGGTVNSAVENIAGVQFTLIAVIIFASTFIPKGSFAFNPKELYGESLDQELKKDMEEDSSLSNRGAQDGKFNVEESTKEDISSAEYVDTPETLMPGGRHSIAGTLRSSSPNGGLSKV